MNSIEPYRVLIRCILSAEGLFGVPSIRFEPLQERLPFFLRRDIKDFFPCQTSAYRRFVCFILLRPSIDGFLVQFTPRSQGQLSIISLTASGLVYVACRNFVLCLDRNENRFQFLAECGPEFIQGHRWHKDAFVPRFYRLFLPNRIDGRGFVALRLHVVEILDVSRFRKCDRKGVHRMMPVIFPFRPVFYPLDHAPVIVVIDEC